MINVESAFDFKGVVDGLAGQLFKKVIVTGLEPATSRPVILRSTIDLHDRPTPSQTNPVKNRNKV